MRIILFLGILLVVFTSFSQDINENLLLHYKFDNNFEDNSENGYHATPFGVVFTEDRNGNANSALYLDGINDFIQFPNVSELKPDLPVSFSFWIRYDSMNYTDRDVFNTSFSEDICSGVFFNNQQSTGRYSLSYGW